MHFRLNLSTSSASNSPFGQRSSVRRTLTGRKRKRGDLEGSFVSQSKSSATFEQSASSSGPVQVYETDVHGKFVKLDHDGPWETSYSHLSRIKVRRGERVKQGQVIGAVGSTGMSTGPHLHYQMWRSGRFVDAMRVELPTSATLAASEKAAFKAAVDKWTPLLPDLEALADDGPPEGEPAGDAAGGEE